MNLYQCHNHISSIYINRINCRSRLKIFAAKSENKRPLGKCRFTLTAEGLELVLYTRHTHNVIRTQIYDCTQLGNVRGLELQ